MDFISSHIHTLGDILNTGWGTLGTVLVGALIVAHAAHRASQRQNLHSAERIPMTLPAIKDQGNRRYPPKFTRAKNASLPRSVFLSPDRIFLGDSITPQYLASFFDDDTDILAEKRAAPFFGKWVAFSGTVENVSAYSKTINISISGPETDDAGATIGTPIAFLYFSKDWSRHVETIRKGDIITAIGMIQDIDRYYISLNSCEIIDPPTGILPSPTPPG